MTRSLSGVGDPLRIDPANIRFKISPVHDLRGMVDGDWDIERRHSLANALKHRSISARYRDGARWEDTELFESYRRRFGRGETVRGVRTLGELIDQYYGRVDGMFADLRARGFDASAGPLPTFLIGRDEVFIGNQGNHRLAMAQALGLKQITGKVVCRHPRA